ncbi:MAG: vanadium-dependent haloperoxidase [Bacteroidetes bacterium]|nr:vanadium-dependent haloperoxidase [Bacteroidota bacterium]
MIKSHRILLGCSLLAFSLSSCKKDEEQTLPNASPDASVYSADVATQWNQLETRLIKTTNGFVPPVAARALGYSNLAAYEAVSPGIEGKRSLDEVMNYSYTLPYANITKKYNWALVSNAAYFQSIKALFVNTSTANIIVIDSLYLSFRASLGANETEEVIKRSESYGAEVADVIYNWSNSDNGYQAYNNLYPTSYTTPTGLGMWEPTPPAFQSIPLLPYWGNNRPFLAANVGSACLPPPPLPYSTESTSAFYQEVLEVYTVSQNLTQDQRDIAVFWADGANTFTPPGHLMNITTQLIKEDNFNLNTAAEIYLRMGLAVNDAFIACWKAKYTHSLLRPVSFIQRNIDASWTPLVTTPPFPEYTSGHSSVSGASSEVLTYFFGNHRNFTDNSNTEFGYPARSFSNFYQAAEEAANSRLYGGIHYRSGNEKGINCGKQIGKNIVRLSLNK